MLCGIQMLLGEMTNKAGVFAQNGDETPNLPENTSFSLNVRLSSRTIHPPKELIKEVFPLTGIRARPDLG